MPPLDSVIVWLGVGMSACAGAIPAIFVGYAWGRKDGVAEGKSIEKHSAKSWSDFVEASGYSKLIPHGNPGHTHTAACNPPDRRGW